MNRNRQLSEETYGKRHAKPHMPMPVATKTKKTQHKGNLPK